MKMRKKLKNFYSNVGKIGILDKIFTFDPFFYSFSFHFTFPLFVRFVIFPTDPYNPILLLKQTLQYPYCKRTFILIIAGYIDARLIDTQKARSKSVLKFIDIYYYYTISLKQNGDWKHEQHKKYTNKLSFKTCHALLMSATCVITMRRDELMCAHDI